MKVHSLGKLHFLPSSRILASLVNFRWAVLVLVALLTVAAQAQVKTGSIVGIVTDKQNARVPDAIVTLTNTGTNQQSIARTDSGGNYVFTLLPPGQYALRIEKTGFENATVPGISLAVGDRLKYDVALDVGAVTQTVQVSAVNPVLQTQTSEVTQLVGEQAVEQLPVESRNYVTLVQLVPGGNYDTSDCCSYGGGPDDRRTPSNITVNAQDNAENNFEIDGMDNNERFVGTELIKPSMDAIQQVVVQTNLYSAQYGRTGGAIINVITKSGTNNFHGDLYEYIRNDAFDASNWVTGKVAPYKQNQFGGSLGGPIVKDRTFFFADYEGYRNIQPTTFVGSVPTDAMRSGNFSDLLLPENYINGAPIQIFDPITKTPYPGNIIPQNGTAATPTGWDTVGHNVLQLYPLATNPDRHLVNNNYARTASNTQNSDTFDIRVDQKFSDHDSLFARYSFENVHAFQPPAIPIGDALVGGPGHQKTQGFQINYDHVWSPTWVSELRLGYSRYVLNSLSYNTGKNLSDQVGLAGSNYSYLSSGLAAFWPLEGTDIHIGDDIYIPDINTNNVYQVEGNATHTMGSHSLMFGGVLRRRQVFQNQSPYSRGFFFFFASQTGNAFASLLSGYPFQFAGGRLTELNIPDYRFNEAGLFVEDDWRAKTWLTLNLGLRWDYYSPIIAPRQISNFDPSTGNILIAGENGVSDTANVQNHWHNFSPRFGFAATLSQKTVLRGGFGISFFPLSMLSPGAFRNAPFISSWTPLQYPGPGPWRLEYGMPAVTPEDPKNPTGPQNSTAFDGLTQYVEQFNLTLQRELPAHLVASVAFVGSLGRHQAFSNWALNVNSPGNGQTLRPLQVNGIAPNVTSVSWLCGCANTRYEGLQATVQRLFNNGLGLAANYTFAHAYDNFNQEPVTLPNGSVHEDNLVWGNSHLDVRDNFTITMEYGLPFAEHARGALGAVAKGWEADLVARAETGFPFTVTNSSGHVAIPIGAPSADRTDQISDPFRAGPVAANPNPACHATVAQGGIAPSRVRVIDGPAGTAWFNPCAFVQQTAGTWGNEGINSLYGPGYVDFDLGVTKNFSLTEKLNLQFTAQAFNLFNHPAFAEPVATLGSAGFGGFNGMAPFLYSPRNLQLALKLSF